MTKERIALAILKEGQEEPCGYVGHSNGTAWKVAKTIEEAQKWTTELLAEGAASQYLGYTRTKYPNTHKAFSLKHVKCE